MIQTRREWNRTMDFTLYSPPFSIFQARHQSQEPDGRRSHTRRAMRQATGEEVTCNVQKVETKSLYANDGRRVSKIRALMFEQVFQLRILVPRGIDDLMLEPGTLTRLHSRSRGLTYPLISGLSLKVSSPFKAAQRQPSVRLYNLSTLLVMAAIYHIALAFPSSTLPLK